MEPEKRLATQLEALRTEHRPAAPLDDDEAELLAVARAVKGLGKPADPSLDFARRMLEGAPRKTAGSRFRRWLALPAAAAVAAVIVIGSTFLPFGGRLSVVQAMEQTVAKIDSYHAIVEYRFEGPQPGRVETQTEEIWYQGDKYAWKNRMNEEIISDGQREWTVNHDHKYANYGFPMTPKLHPFQPENLLKAVRNQPYTIEGTEQIAGRQTTRVGFEVPQLKSYHIWIDNETKLPLQIERRFWSGTRDTETYKTFDLNGAIDPSRFTYKAPEDYQVIDGGRQVATVAEAAAIAGFQPVVPKEAPHLIVVRNGGVVMGFGGDVLIDEGPERKLYLDQRQSYGWAGEGPVRTLGEQHFDLNRGGVNITIDGSERALDVARQIAPDLSTPYEPYRNPYLVNLIEQPITVDMEAAMAAEVAHAKNPYADDGRSYTIPVAVRFVGELGTAVSEAAFYEAGNNGAEAIVTVSEGPVSKVYLRRVARQDERGLWWVIGYDKR